MRIPKGFTFVKARARGGMGEEQRMRIYRSRSASKMPYEEVATTLAGNHPAWFDFEKDCARLLAACGMKVIHQAA